MSDAPRPDAKRGTKSRRTASLTRTQVSINIYDLLPASRLADCMWHLGTSCLHSGVVIGDKEYAYGRHEKPGVSGVFWTRPNTLPPGAFFRTNIVQGFTFRSPDEIEQIIQTASHRFMGSDWNLLRNNCNHFTSYLCQQLTGRSAPPWLNRAASIATAFPCLIPRTWQDVPDAETADGELVDEEPVLDDIDEGDESAGMLQYRQPDPIRSSSDTARTKNQATRDSSGRALPVSERAPPPRG